MSAVSDELNKVARDLLARMHSPQVQAVLLELIDKAHEEPDVAALLKEIRGLLSEQLAGDEEFSGLLPDFLTAILPPQIQAGVALLSAAKDGVVSAINAVKKMKHDATSGHPAAVAAMETAKKAAKVLDHQAATKNGASKGKTRISVKSPKRLVYLPGLASYYKGLHDLAAR